MSIIGLCQTLHVADCPPPRAEGTAGPNREPRRRLGIRSLYNSSPNSSQLHTPRLPCTRASLQPARPQPFQKRPPGPPMPPTRPRPKPHAPGLPEMGYSSGALPEDRCWPRAPANTPPHLPRTAKHRHTPRPGTLCAETVPLNCFHGLRDWKVSPPP